MSLEDNIALPLSLNGVAAGKIREKVRELAGDIHSAVIGTLDRSDIVSQAEELGKTVVEAFPDSPMAGQYRALADAVLAAAKG